MDNGKQSSKRKLRAPAVAQRYNCGLRTLDRWVESGALPKPIYIHKMRFWDEDELDAYDEARKA
jgi:predicted DNA-binding transcriptional regulator AlpA